MEIRGRRRGMASVLRLCQRLLEEPEPARGSAASDPDAERDSLQLLAVNLERRWEAIVMQALQWQTRLQRDMGREQVRRRRRRCILNSHTVLLLHLHLQLEK